MAGDEQFRNIVLKKSDKYFAKFKKFKSEGRDGFSATWNWPAFLIPSIWLFYRKMYFWGILSLVLYCNLLVNIPGRIVLGIAGNYIYYKHAKKKINKIIDRNPNVDQGELNRLLGKKEVSTFL